MQDMQEASFYSREANNRVRCGLCNHYCRIAEGRRGLCGVRENRDGVLYTLVYGRVVAENVDPIEKKPLFHFLPGSRSCSISTVGCNFVCKHCQNYQISQYPNTHQGAIEGRELSPQQVLQTAVDTNCTSISYTYVEPTIFYEFARDCMELAHQQSIANVFVSNGYMSSECTRALAPRLDGINIDLKSFSDDFYTTICGAHLQPVLDNILLMRELGVWVEVTTLIIPGYNDSSEELAQIAAFIHQVDPAIPWHVTAFYPTWKLTDSEPTPLSTLQRAREIGLNQGLRFVYASNIPGQGGEDTLCPGCGTKLVARTGFRVTLNHIRNGQCPDCGEKIEGVWG